MVCILSGLALTLVAHWIVQVGNLKPYIGPAPLIYSSLMIIFTFATWILFYQTDVMNREARPLDKEASTDQAVEQHKFVRKIVSLIHRRQRGDHHTSTFGESSNDIRGPTTRLHAPMWWALRRV